jgi:hypothetical protein
MLIDLGDFDAFKTVDTIDAGDRFRKMERNIEIRQALRDVSGEARGVLLAS